ncbi:MAG: hypothetical protein GEU75_13090 [Dehalococcoidia bacterium]|nr:hypothetical protein [Dehalococcoidia bacterium]
MYSFELILALGVVLTLPLVTFAWRVTRKPATPLLEEDAGLRRDKEAAIAEAVRWLHLTSGRSR